MHYIRTSARSFSSTARELQLQLAADHPARFGTWHGLTGQLAYTWAHALDDVTSTVARFRIDSFNLGQEYGNSDFDTRHNFTTFLSYDDSRLLSRSEVAHARMGGEHLYFASQRPAVQLQRRIPRAASGLNIIGDPYAGVSHSFSRGAGRRAVGQSRTPSALRARRAARVPRIPTAIWPGTPCTGLASPMSILSVFKNIPIKERLQSAAARGDVQRLQPHQSGVGRGLGRIERRGGRHDRRLQRRSWTRAGRAVQHAVGGKIIF